MNVRRGMLALGIVMVGWMATGCATVTNGTHQDLTVTSQPEALCVSINGEPHGATPAVVSLPRNKTYVVEVQYEHYQPYQVTVVPVMSGMVWGNLILGGLIGMAVDSGTGAGYEHSPSRVHAYFPIPINQATPRPVCQESASQLEARRKAAEKAAERAMFVKSGYTPYEQPMGR
jgi:hypothetical protein